jgi:hypothetical protein
MADNSSTETATLLNGDVGTYEGMSEEDRIKRKALMEKCLEFSQQNDPSKKDPGNDPTARDRENLTREINRGRAPIYSDQKLYNHYIPIPEEKDVA